MNEQQQHYLTSEGASKLKVELAQLKGPAREELAQRLRAAIQMGDLSENADYHKAKEDQAFLEGRIQELEYLLKNATIIAESAGPHEAAEIGARVTVQEEDFDPESYLLVGAKEADPRNGKISNESPIGRALLGHRVGDIVDVQTPGGLLRLKITEIE
jgi:transcription elongation factor GreA